MTAEQRRARAYSAKALIEDPTLQQGWTDLENDLRSQWERTILPRKRDRIWMQLKHLRDLRGKLANFAGQARD